MPAVAVSDAWSRSRISADLHLVVAVPRLGDLDLGAGRRLGAALGDLLDQLLLDLDRRLREDRALHDERLGLPVLGGGLVRRAVALGRAAVGRRRATRGSVP